jgi:hypothetical protein
MSKYKPGDMVAVRGEVYLSGGALAVGLCPEGSGFRSAVRLDTAEVLPWDAERIAELEAHLREKDEIIKAYAGPTRMTPEDVAALREVASR